MDKVPVLIDEDEYWVEGGDFEDLLDVVKRIPGRRFDPEEHRWTLPGPPQHIARAVAPFALMYVDDDFLADSRPLRVTP